MVNGWKPLTVLAKGFIFDVWQDSEYASILYAFDETVTKKIKCIVLVNCILLQSEKPEFSFLYTKNEKSIEVNASNKQTWYYTFWFQTK